MSTALEHTSSSTINRAASGTFGFIRRGPSIVLGRMAACGVCHEICEEHYLVAGFSHPVCSECIVRSRVPFTSLVALAPHLAEGHVVVLSHAQLQVENVAALEVLTQLRARHVAVEHRDLPFLAQHGVLEHVESLFIIKSSDATLSPNEQQEEEIANLLSPSHLPRITLFAAHNDFPLKRCMASIAQLTTLESVDLDWCEDVTDTTVPFLRRLPQLKALFLSHCEGITDAGVISLFSDDEGDDKAAPFQLEILDLSWCKKITDIGIIALCNGSTIRHSLRCLNISGVHLVTQGAFLGSVAASLHRLETLNVAYCTCITDAAIAAFTSDADAAQHLTSLNLSNCPGISDHIAESLIKFVNLQLLDLSSHEELTNAVLLHTISNGGLQQLTTLNVSGVTLLTSASIHAVLEDCPVLETLDVSWCPDVDDGAFSGAAVVPLRELNVSWCKSLTDAALQSIASRFGATLESLELFSLVNITDDGVSAVAQTMPKLATLNVSWCRGVTDASLVTLASTAAPLTSFAIAGNAKITDEGLAALLSAKRGTMEQLDVSRCERLNGRALAALQQTDRSALKTINISFCRELSEASLLNAVRTSPIFGANLQTLDLSGNRHVTDAILDALSAAACSTSLQTLTLSRCSSVSPNGILALKRVRTIDTTCCKKFVANISA